MRPRRKIFTRRDTPDWRCRYPHIQILPAITFPAALCKSGYAAYLPSLG